MAKAKTKVELYQEIMALTQTKEQKDFIEKCIAQTQAHNSKKGKNSPKATQNMAELKAIKEFVGNKSVTYKDIRAKFPDKDYTSQKITAILSLDDTVVKTKNKGITYVSFGKEEQAES